MLRDVREDKTESEVEVQSNYRCFMADCFKSYRTKNWSIRTLQERCSSFLLQKSKDDEDNLEKVATPEVHNCPYQSLGKVLPTWNRKSGNCYKIHQWFPIAQTYLGPPSTNRTTSEKTKPSGEGFDPHLRMKNIYFMVS